jgi:D-alanine-D-alanine ligase
VPIRVLHLVGSAVSEFFCDLSRLYAADCLEATADDARYEFHIAYVTPDRRWRFPADLTPDAIRIARPRSLDEAVARITALHIDVVIPQMFCIPGMTAYRALFDVLEIPYVGNTPAVMSVAADKAKAKAIVAAAGVRVPAGQLLRPDDAVRLAPPAVVKPVDADNSVGVSLVRDRSEYPAALATAFTHSGQVLVESYVELGREVRCGVVERDGALVCLPLEEYNVDSTSKPIRSDRDKITRGADGELHLVAKDSTRAWIVDPGDPATEAVWEAAAGCHLALGCRHYSLFDFRIDPAGNPWFLEAGLYSSFARKSVISVMAAASGMPLSSLFASMIHRATAA